jgi:hypothetical protein
MPATNSRTTPSVKVVKAPDERRLSDAAEQFEPLRNVEGFV